MSICFHRLCYHSSFQGELANSSPLALGNPRFLRMPSSVAAVHAAAEIDSEDATSSSASSSHQSSASESGSESDSLESVSSRKRQKLSDESIPKGALDSSSVNIPSRIKRGTGGAPAVAPKLASRPPTEEVPLDAPITVPVDHSASFEALNLRPWLIQSLANMAIKRPTKIQQLTIPAILEGRDVIGTSRTGSGKTVAFTAPILQIWAQDPSSIFAVVLTATREL